MTGKGKVVNSWERGKDYVSSIPFGGGESGGWNYETKGWIVFKN